MSKKTGISLLFVFSVLTLISLAPLSKNACANNEIAEQTCDVGVWNAMAARARLETEREIMQNQNLIFKADSILSYVCFDAFAGHASLNVGDIFSNGNQAMAGSMDSVVINSMTAYINSNFNHSLMGGRGHLLGLGNANTPPQVNGGARDYSCEVMNNVWQRAKCMNFMHVEQFVETDGFYPFIDLAPVDGAGAAVLPIRGYESRTNVRDYPAPCDGNDPPFVAAADGAGASGSWADVYHYSRNESGGLGVQGDLYEFQDNVNTTFDAVHDMTRPGDCGNNDNAIPTGVRVMLSGAATANQIYLDGVCTNPGCSYAKGGAGAVGTCTTTPAVPAGGNQPPP